MRISVRNRRRSLHPEHGLQKSDITIILPTKNEASNIVKFLDSVPEGIETVVVDASQDETPDLIESLRESVTIVRSNSNISTARQLGSQYATTPWLLFTDADVAFADDYFDQLSRIAIGGNDAGLVGAKSTIGEFDTYYRWFCRGQAVLTKLGIPAATGSNMLVRADALRAVGGFDRELSVNEDTELMFRIKKAGYSVSFEPGLVVRSFDQRRLEAGLVRKIAHGAVRNTALYLGIFGSQLRRNDWGYWTTDVAADAKPTSQ